jgi:hypothetical protein
VEKVAGFSRKFGFASKGISPGLYRLTVEIRNRSDKLLEKHEQAFRAMPAKSDLRLWKSFDSLAAGESGLIRIENYGTVEATFGGNYRLWSSTGQEIPVSPIFGNVLYQLGAGLAGPCWTFTVPASLPPGEYRIGSTASDFLRRNQLLTVLFSVV